MLLQQRTSVAADQAIPSESVAWKGSRPGEAWRGLARRVASCARGRGFAFGFLMLFFRAECLKGWPPVKYACKRDSESYHKTWHFLLRLSVCDRHHRDNLHGNGQYAPPVPRAL